MHSLKRLAIMALGATVATVESVDSTIPDSPTTVSDSGCRSPSLSVSSVYITVPGSSITETVYANSPGVSTINASAEAVKTPTLTVTNVLASTQLISIIQASEQSGPYSFTEDNGTTVWMGGRTPPASAQLITSTAIVTLQPVYSSVPVAMEGPSAAPTTSFVTVTVASIQTLQPVYSSVPAVVEGPSAAPTTAFVTVTVTSTHTVTETFTQRLTQSITPATPTFRGYTGFGTAGWNASLTTFVIVTSGSEPFKPSAKPSLVSNHTSHQGTAHALPTPSQTQLDRVKARQVGEIIAAIIDGIAVSWTNNYDGSTASTSFAGENFVPVTATAPAFGGALSLSVSSSSPIKRSSSSAAASITALPIYPWDLSAASTSWATQPATTVAVNTWTSLQWGLHPPPSMESGFHWIPVTSSTTAVNSVIQTVVPTAHPGPATSSRYNVTTRASVAVSFSVISSNVSATTGSTVTSATSSCSPTSAIFTVDFDDLPFFSTGPDDIDIPPIFNPYRKLFWEGHFGYVPPPTDPFPPNSPPQLSVYRETGPISAGSEIIGGIGAGPRADYTAYWIDAQSAWLGCADGGPNECIIEIKGYTHGGSAAAAVTQSVTQPPCPGLKNCSLALVNFDGGFRGLTTVQITASVNSKAIDYYMDDLQLAWTNNSCAAQLKRSSSR